MTIDQAIEDYLREKSVLGTLSETTVVTRRSELNQFSRFCADIGIDHPADIIRNDILNYIEKRIKGGIQKVTQVSIMYTLSGFLEYLTALGYQINNHITDMGVPKAPYPDTDYLYITEVIELFNSERLLATDKTRARNLLFMNMCFTLCLRSSEATNVKISDINLNSEYLWTVRKGGKRVKIPLNTNLVEQIIEWKNVRATYAGSDSDWLFLSSRGKKLTGRQAHYIVSKALKRAGITKRKAGPHLLRHSGATHHLQNGRSIKVVQRMLGHSSLAITDKYLHFNESEFKCTIDMSVKL